MKLPKTLQEAIHYFADPDRCLDLLVAMRWPNGPVCPRCNSMRYGFLKSRSVWQCKECRKQYTAKLGTIFEDSPIPLEKWFCALWLLVNAKNGISSYEVARALGVTQKTAWFMMHRLRLALQKGSLDRKLMGDVEVDETYIGGEARNMHRDKQIKMKRQEGFLRKAVVVGMLERKGEVRAEVINRATSDWLKSMIKKHIVPGSNLYSDQWRGYLNAGKEYAHKVINHAEAYVQGNIHTNSIESFWSLLKRGIKGTYVSVEPFHLFRYLDEQSFRFNTRKDNDQGRFMAALSSVQGKRVDYKELIGQTTC
ncbi:MAG TPA: IS1595 family transposase [Nitrospiraceae bacterium]|nr:IS1595 family transposase [Nitrospiraceae bacterium]